jgi:hypothetical protein
VKVYSPPLPSDGSASTIFSNTAIQIVASVVA